MVVDILRTHPQMAQMTQMTRMDADTTQRDR
jgi:hypothetical protein